MSWWRKHGSGVLMMAGLWLIISDPIPGWLPAPIPVLVPGHDTTWVPQVVVTAGRPDYAAIIDRDRAPQLKNLHGPTQIFERAVNAQGAQLSELVPLVVKRWRDQPSILEESLAGTYHHAFPEAHSEGDPGAHSKLQAQAVRTAHALVGTGSGQEIAVPVLTSDDEAKRSLLPVGSLSHMLVIETLGSALWQALQAPVTDESRPELLDQAVDLARLGTVAAATDDIFALALAYSMQGDALWTGARIIGPSTNELAWRKTSAETLLGISAPRLDPDFLRYTRLLLLRWMVDVDTSMRSGATTVGIGAVRSDYPADINSALRRMNQRWDEFEALFAPCPARADILAVDIDQLVLRTLPVASARAQQPLANRLLFQPSLPEGQQEAAEVLVSASLVRASAAMQTLRLGIARVESARVLLTVLAELPPLDSATAMRERLEQACAALPADVRPTIAGEGRVVTMTLAPSDAQFLQPFRMVCTSP